MNGVSKKLCLTGASIAAIASLSTDAPDRLPYAIIIGVLCIVYKVVQGYIDLKNPNK